MKSLIFLAAILGTIFIGGFFVNSEEYIPNSGGDSADVGQYTPVTIDTYDSNRNKIQMTFTHRTQRVVVDELNKIYENYDIIIAPNGGGVAPLIDEAAEDYLSDEYIILENWLCLANFAGTPSISIPSGFVDNMPVAVNISGRIFEEQTVLNVAYALEEALGFKNQYKRED